MDNLAVRNKTTISRRLALGWGAFGLLTVVALGAISSPSWAATEDEAGEFLSSLTARSIEQLTDMSVSEVERKARFRELFSQNFDVAAIGRFDQRRAFGWRFYPYCSAR